jgi:hypothetical protein
MTTTHADIMASVDDMTDAIRQVKTLSDELSALGARLNDLLMTTGPRAELDRLRGQVEEAWDSLGHDRGS